LKENEILRGQIEKERTLKDIGILPLDPTQFAFSDKSKYSISGMTITKTTDGFNTAVIPTVILTVFPSPYFSQNFLEFLVMKGNLETVFS
jgi:hypothetical protein